MLQYIFKIGEAVNAVIKLGHNFLHMDANFSLKTAGVS